MVNLLTIVTASVADSIRAIGGALQCGCDRARVKVMRTRDSRTALFQHASFINPPYVMQVVAKHEC